MGEIPLEELTGHAVTPLGHVSIVPRGDYSPEATYHTLHAVVYNYNGYVALKDNLTGVSPEDDTAWALLVSSGSAELAKLYSDQAKASADRAAASEKVVTDNKAALDAVKDNLDAIQGAPDAADRAKESADRAEQKAQEVAGGDFVTHGEVGAENGVAGLDGNKKVPSGQLPVAGSGLGAVKSGGDITVAADGSVSVNNDSHTHEIANVTSLQDTLNGKAPSNHTHPNASGTAAGFMSTDDKNKLDSIEANANKYAHPTGNGNNHIPAGGSAGQILRWKEAGVAEWGADANTSYSSATDSVPGILKLYGATGTQTDGAMTVKATTDALNGKALSSHTHAVADVTTLQDTLNKKADKTATDPVVTWHCNPNLLDNWFFVNPVNQRGQTEYTAKNAYTIDRWLLEANGSIKIQDGYIQQTSSTDVYMGFDQKLEKNFVNVIRGRTITLSVLYKTSTNRNSITVQALGTTLYEKYEALPVSEDWNLHSVTYTNVLNETTTALNIRIISEPGQNSVSYKAIKLEFGDRQTLAHKEGDAWVLNETPSYAEELSKCQRYYQVFTTEALRPTEAEDFRPPMRIKPTKGTITVGGKTLYTADANL